MNPVAPSDWPKAKFGRFMRKYGLKDVFNKNQYHID